MQFILSGKIGERRRIAEVLEEFCQANRVPDQALRAADLALEEHLTNVLSYGFEPGMVPWVMVRLTLGNGCLFVEVTDAGRPHNPLATPPVDTSVPLADKPIGGLGVHLMRQFMDELAYVHEGGRNVLRMTKHFEKS